MKIVRNVKKIRKKRTIKASEKTRIKELTLIY